MTENSITFLPYLKRQPSLPIRESQPGVLSATLEINIIDNHNQSHTVGTQELMLRGAGDILGISRRAIARTEPQAGTHDFEPNYFPFIEFVDPDFPWRYSLDKINPAEIAALPKRIYPWLSLIVLSNDEIAEMQNAGIDVITLLSDRREFLSVQGKYLPNLNHAWATAHVQLGGLDRAIEKFIEEKPANHCSRLFCCRQLQAETQYTAFLIPTYKIAVQAAFGIATEGIGDAKAWENPDDGEIIRLPIYYQWSFATSEGGDFEYLARHLQPSALDAAKVGTAPIDANLMVPATRKLDRFFLREGALAVPGFASNRQPYAQGSQPLPLTMPMLEALNESLKSSPESLADAATEDEDPLITLPVYGRYFRNTQEIALPVNNQWLEPTPWIHELNLDFRHRVAAAFGTTVVQKNQEEYVKECWLQVGKIREANEKLRRTQAGYQIAKALEKKHIAPLSDERFVLLSSPFHTHFALAEKGTKTSLKQALVTSGISRGILSPTFRRVAHRQIGIAQVKPFKAMETAKACCFYIRPRVPKNHKIPAMTPMVSEFFAKLPQSNLEVLPPKQPIIPIEPVDIGQEFRAKFDIKQVLTKKLEGVIKLANGSAISENFDPIMASPKIDRAMYEPLASLSSDYILPGIKFLENNGVTLCEENRRFIEAYMVGLNHEMGGELIWRHYPTDRRGTIFSYFWNAIAAVNPLPDIREIHQWTKNLGFNQHQSSQGANLVLVIKGDLIRRYPATIVYALKVTVPDKAGKSWKYWSEVYPNNNPPMDQNHIIKPILRAQVGNDILLVGFPFSLKNVRGGERDGEYYFVLQENQDLPRFGLDIASPRMQPDSGCGTADIDINDFRWSDVSQDRAGYINQFSLFGETSAAVANKTYQIPIRVAIHASELLPIGGM
jgi:hypothetical protein